MSAGDMVDLSLDEPIWGRFYTVAPLVVIGTTEVDGAADLAPKHMAGPMSWQNMFGFVCSPSHATYRNVVRTGEFTASYPRPEQILQASLAAAPRAADASKPALAALDVVPAGSVSAPLLAGAAIHLECRLDRMVDQLGENSLVIGTIVAARVPADALRDPDRDDADVIAAAPPLAFLAPDHFAAVSSGHHFPFHAGWRR